MKTEYIVTLLLIPGVGRGTVLRILDQAQKMTACPPDLFSNIGKFENTFELDLKQVYELFRLSVDKQELKSLSYDKFREYHEEAIKRLEMSEKNKIRVVNITEEHYPKRLKKLWVVANKKVPPPVILSVKGNIEVLDHPKSIAIIGTRHPSKIGYRIAEYIGHKIASNNIVVVSGLARGCDTQAHLGCLKANGVTVAVLAHGLNMIYPRENRKLAFLIVDTGGCLVSEYIIGTPPHKNYFIERDRIQSALSDAVIVVETGIEGGSMHTIEFAKSLEKPVAACFADDENWRRHEKAQGNLELINSGNAFKLTSASLSEFINLVYSNTFDNN